MKTRRLLWQLFPANLLITLGALLISDISLLVLFLGWPIFVLLMGESDIGPVIITITNPFVALSIGFGNSSVLDPAIIYILFFLLFGIGIFFLWHFSADLLEKLRARDR